MPSSKPSSKKRRTRRGWGWIRPLPSGRFQASYPGPDGLRRNAPQTFETRADADAWLAQRRAEILTGTWQAPAPAEKAKTMTFRTYAEAWLAGRTLAPRTRELYRSLLDNHLLPTFGDTPLTATTVTDVKTWWGALDTGPSARANAYSLLRSIFGEAADDELIVKSPVHIKGAGTKKRARVLRVLTPAQLDEIVRVIPARYKALVLLGGWCCLRFGELAALRRSDLDLKNRVVHVRRALIAIPGTEKFESEPKSGSVRDVTIPKPLVPILKAHLREHAAFGRDGLVFPPRDPETMFLALSTLHRVWDRAKVTAGRTDVRVHDLRHFGGIMAARAGATLGEIMERGGWSTAQAALIYQSAASERPMEIADRLSKMMAKAK